MNSHALIRVALFLLLLSPPLVAQVVVFWQPGFPTIASQPVDRATLSTVLHPDFLDLTALQGPNALAKAELLVLPYGSAVPTDAWKAIEAYLQHGGNLLVLGGQPLRVPVTQSGAVFVQGRPQDTYSRVLDLRHTYEVPVARDAHFAWRPGYAFETIADPPGREILHRRRSSQRTRLHGRPYWAVGRSAGHRDRSSTGQPHRLYRLSADPWVLGESGWHGAHSPVCRLCAPGFDQPFG